MRLAKLLLYLALALLVTAASAQTFQVLSTFHFTDGSTPNGSLVRDKAGNLYGTTQLGGTSGRGVVFKLNSAGQETILYNFTGKLDGGIPIGRLIGDSANNIYGITSLGGDPTCSCGTVFKLAPSGTLTVLHSFLGGTDGAQNSGQPELGLVMIGGDLYGSASFGGVSGCDGTLGCGVIFKVTQSGEESVIYRFTGKADGAFPQDLIADNAGNIYGATGGSYSQGNAGTIFKMTTAGAMTVLYTLPGGTAGNSPRWRLLRSASGTFYGVTQFGGDTNCPVASSGCGVVFMLSPAGKETVLHMFNQQANDGLEPSGGTMDAAGNLYGATFYGGTINSTCTFGCGVVYKIAGNGKYSVLYDFTGGNDGWIPTGGLTPDGAGNLYGTTVNGGASGNGVVYKITP
jgi:uncharacterized repeat protein (TIGR03803 family)